MNIPKAVPSSFIGSARSLESIGVADPTWTLETARLLVDAVRGGPLAILGGDIYLDCEGRVDTAHCGWYCERHSGESFNLYAARSQARAADYLAADNLSRSGCEALVGFVMSDEPTAGL